MTFFVPCNKQKWTKGVHWSGDYPFFCNIKQIPKEKKHHTHCYCISKHRFMWPGIMCLIGGISHYCGQLSCNIYWTNSWPTEWPRCWLIHENSQWFGNWSICYQPQPICVTSSTVHRVSVDKSLTTKGKTFGRRLEKSCTGDADCWLIHHRHLNDWWLTDTMYIPDTLLMLLGPTYTQLIVKGHLVDWHSSNISTNITTDMSTNSRPRYHSLHWSTPPIWHMIHGLLLVTRWSIIMRSASRWTYR